MIEVHTWLFVIMIVALVIAAIYISYQESKLNQLKKENKKLTRVIQEK